MRLEIALPYPPSVNHYDGHTRFGGVYVTAKGKEYRQMVALILMGEKKGVSFGAAPVSVSIGVHLPLMPQLSGGRPSRMPTFRVLPP